MAPSWLTAFAIIHLVLSSLSALIVAGDILSGHRQKMAVMNFVWPITALWAGPLGLALYWILGRRGPQDHEKKDKPLWQSALIGDAHCGAGCTLGDFVGEWLVYLTGLTIAGSVLWADYLFDFVLAYLAGIVFQYYSIAPMRGLSGWRGIKAALKADTVSLVAFEIGMFAWMALSSQVLFDPRLSPTQPVYWYMMQVAMLVGFLTAYPANWWLLNKGSKNRCRESISTTLPSPTRSHLPGFPKRAGQMHRMNPACSASTTGAGTISFRLLDIGFFRKL